MIKTIDSSVLRSHFKDAMLHIKTSKKPLIIKQRNIPTAVLIDIDEFENYVTSKDKEFLVSIQKARNEYKAGMVFTAEDVFADIS